MNNKTKRIIGAIIILFLVVFAKGELPAILSGKSFGEALPALMKFAAKAAIGAGIICGTIVLCITVKNKASKKSLIAVGAVILLLLAGSGIYIANGLHHKPEVFRQMLTEKVQEDADKLFKGVGTLFGIPDLSFYDIDDNLLDHEGKLITLENQSSSTKLSLYQSKADDMALDINEYRISDIKFNGKDPSFGNLETAEVTIVFKWYDLSEVTGEFNRYAYNRLLPYIMVGSETTKTFQIIDDLMLSILEKAEAAGKTREYEFVYEYYLSEAGSNPITGEGASWSCRETLLREPIREMVLKELDYEEQFEDDPSEEELNKRKEIVINMETAIELFGKDGARELLESLGYEGLVSKMIAEYSPEESPEQ